MNFINYDPNDYHIYDLKVNLLFLYFTIVEKKQTASNFDSNRFFAFMFLLASAHISHIFLVLNACTLFRCFLSRFFSD